MLQATLTQALLPEADKGKGDTTKAAAKTGEAMVLVFGMGR